VATLNLTNRFATPITDINVVAVVKDKPGPREHWIFLYDDANKVEALRQAGRWAANPELSFNWLDAVIVSQKIRGEREG